MGKYMRKIRGGAALEGSQAVLGVRTRARTLALQQGRSNLKQELKQSQISYLELRNRKLEKNLPVMGSKDEATVGRPEQEGSNSDEKTIPAECQGECSPENSERVAEVAHSRTNSAVLGSSFDAEAQKEGLAPRRTLEIDVSVCENVEADMLSAKESQVSRVPETTRIEPRRDPEEVTQTGLDSLPLQYTSGHRISGSPSADEIENFLFSAEEEQRKRFTERYNFDLKNEEPLPGRYDWVQVQR